MQATKRRSDEATKGNAEKGWTFKGKIIGRFNDGLHITIFPYQGHHVRAMFPRDFYLKVEQVSSLEIRTFDPAIAKQIEDTIKLQHDLILESRRLG